jgi:hypothetical protein
VAAAVAVTLLPVEDRRAFVNYPGMGADYPPAWFLRKADQARAIMVLRTSWN